MILMLHFSIFILAQDSIRIGDLDKVSKDQLKHDKDGNTYYYNENLKAKVIDVNGEKVIVMDELVLLSKPRFNNELDRRYYFFLNKKLNRVYPLFLVALEQYRDLKAKIGKMPRSQQRDFTKQQYKILAQSYEKQLRNLTPSEGQVFCKLLSRATGENVYSIIKEMRGGWSAFWWNVKGDMVDIDLKKDYDPHQFRDDEFIENLLLSNWNLGYLNPYPGYKDFKVKK